MGIFFIISSNKEPVRECVGWCNVMWLFKITSLEIGTSEQLEEGLPSMRDASSSSALPKTDVVTVIQHPGCGGRSIRSSRLHRQCEASLGCMRPRHNQAKLLNNKLCRPYSANRKILMM